MGYCNSCGAPIPNGQNNCSMCMGVLGWGNDGYYEQWLKEQEKEYQLKERHMKELQRQEVLRQQKMEEDKKLLMAFYKFMGYSSYDPADKFIDDFLEEYHAEN